jgi:hypothetical protein
MLVVRRGRAAQARAGADRDLVPGRVVRVPVPPSWRTLPLTVVHRHELLGETRAPAPPARGLLWPTVAVIAMPHDGRLKPGRHEFHLEAPDRQLLRVGGFEVTRFWLGC